MPVLIAAETVTHVTALGYAIAAAVPLAGPLAAFAYWIAKGRPHADD